jgi:hypothetical protein
MPELRSAWLLAEGRLTFAQHCKRTPGEIH